MSSDLIDLRVRLAAFNWLQMLFDTSGDVFLRSVLAEGFEFEGSRVHLISPAAGIFKPRMLDLPLSISSTTTGPYRDEMGPNHLEYRYRGKDPIHPDNVGLRECMRLQRPLIYFYSLVPGKYSAEWPVYVVGDNPQNLTFQVDVDDRRQIGQAKGEHVAEAATEARRQYVTTIAKRRLHQRAFRERVLIAYRNQCALCRLRHTRLLEASHIVPDSHPDGEPVVRNGIAFCKLHHAAFDSNILGVRPDYTAEIKLKVLEEIDGPMLKHGLQEMHGVELLVPTRSDNRPDKRLLETRYELFLKTA